MLPIASMLSLFFADLADTIMENIWKIVSQLIVQQILNNVISKEILILALGLF